eukprot:NODE_813_length_1321_cov_74.933962_g618_i0.p1 GENE.NODE_813_length_1321_cov_74.933962_g618_i0~~NODE_813_length_1321_cov_74.933962_g618_i0.p1  ORF type:complete len:376 (-),score=108.30 NODE_813_length_1321_cov_74.933962_g618_i0:99-1226(-)
MVRPKIGQRKNETKVGTPDYEVSFLQRQTVQGKSFRLRPSVREKKVKRKYTMDEKAARRRKVKAERRAFRKRVELKHPDPVPVDDTRDPEDEKRWNTAPCHQKVDTHKKQMVMRVTLHKIPEQYVNLDITNRHFHLDTAKWSRHWVVDQDFDDGIEVDPEKAEAVFEHSELVVRVPITKFPTKAKDRQRRISSSVRDGKSLRFVQTRKGELVGVRKINNATQKVTASSAKPGPTVAKKRKRFVEGKDEILSIVERAAKAEEDRMASKQKQMDVMAAYFAEKKQFLDEKKMRKAAAKDKAVKNILNAKGKTFEEKSKLLPPPAAAGKVATTTSRVSKSVSFAATPAVAVFKQDLDEPSRKRKKKGSREATAIEYKN